MSNRTVKGAGKPAPAPAPMNVVSVAQNKVEKVELQPVTQAPVQVAPAPPTTMDTTQAVIDAAMVAEKGPKVQKKAPVDKTKGASKTEIKVRATNKGFYGNIRREVGEEFTIRSEQFFSHNWMEKI